MKFCYLALLFLAACSMPEEKKLQARIDQLDQPVMQSSSDSNAAITAPDKDVPLPLPAPKPVKKPDGIYHGVFPSAALEQTISFSKDFTYELQEKYSANKKDSFVRVTGNWTPSDGFIWLYKDQVVRGRYKWKGDTLQYFNPEVQKNITMAHLTDVMDSKAWRDREQQGVKIFAVGNEPFWSAEFTSKDTISFSLADWSHPIKFHLSSTQKNGDSTSYIAANDSSQIRLTVLPFFCTDGMSEFVYRNRISVAYKTQVYEGCGTVFH
jgi:uncharacterized membrane protein